MPDRLLAARKKCLAKLPIIIGQASDLAGKTFTLLRIDSLTSSNIYFKTLSWSSSCLKGCERIRALVLSARRF